MKKILSLVAISALIFGANACIDPMSPYSVGVVFSGGEQMNLGKIAMAGTNEQSYLKECPGGAGDALPVHTGTVDGKPLDGLTVDSAAISGNILTIGVSYGGGCKDHDIQLYWDGVVLFSLPGQINLMLTHDKKDDMCKAMVSTTVKFDLTGIDAGEVQINLYAPGSTEAVKRLLWTPAASAVSCSYKFRSAYSPDVMVYAGLFKGMFSSEAGSVHQVLLIFDTVSVPSKATKVEALLAEITRLSAMGVLSLSKTQIGSLGTQLKATDGQYWTKEDTVLYFNQWFNGNGVDGVRSVYSAKGCGSGVAYELPAEPLPSTSIAAPAYNVSSAQYAFGVKLDGNGITARYTPLTGATHVRVADMQGRTVALQPASGGRVSVPLSALSRGCYAVSLVGSGKVYASRMITFAGK